MMDLTASHVSFWWMYICVATKIRGTKQINPIGDPFVQKKVALERGKSQCDGEEESVQLSQAFKISSSIFLSS